MFIGMGCARLIVRGISVPLEVTRGICLLIPNAQRLSIYISHTHTLLQLYLHTTTTPHPLTKEAVTCADGKAMFKKKILAVDPILEAFGNARTLVTLLATIYALCLYVCLKHVCVCVCVWCMHA